MDTAKPVFIQATCGKCGKVHRLPANLAGRKVKCSQCHTVVAIPAAGAESTPPPAAGQQPPAKQP